MQVGNGGFSKGPAICPATKDVDLRYLMILVSVCLPASLICSWTRLPRAHPICADIH